MLAQRTLQASSRRLAGLQPTTAFTRLAPPFAIATGNLLQRRQAASASSEADILAKQRVNRPVSPHLGIYQPQITWYLSILHRITGSVLSGGLYIFGFGYLVSPLLGWHWNSAALVASFAALPVVAKVLLKATMAFPFVFHSLNGIRHLSWDMLVGLNNKAVIQTGWTVLGLTAAATLWFAVGY